jgi:hypothetical protein
VSLRWCHRPNANDINCQQAVSLVNPHVHAAVRRADRERLEAHLADFACTEHLRQIRPTILVTGGLHPESLDPVARENLLQSYGDASTR